jgi:hypothetical protein
MELPEATPLLEPGIVPDLGPASTGAAAGPAADALHTPCPSFPGPGFAVIGAGFADDLGGLHTSRKVPVPMLGIVLEKLAPSTRDWAHRAPQADLVLALDLGLQCLQAVRALCPGLAPLPSAGSAERGASAEDEMYELLGRARRIRDVSRRAHSGDLLCDTAAGPVLIEVKHYSTTVPSAEVDKFLRDLRDRDAAAGVFLSLTSPIVGQRESVAVVLEPRVATGTLVPVVFAAPARGGAGRLSPEIALAAVDMAAALAEVYPRGLRGLHGRDASLAYATAAEQLADGAHSVRGELVRLASSLAGEASLLGDRLASLGREARELARVQRAEAEEIREVAPDGAALLIADLRAKYPVCASDDNLARVLRAIEGTSLVAGILGEQNRWHLLKARAVHYHSGCGFSFLKGATLVRVPTARLTAETIADLLKAHPKKVGLADEAVSLVLDDATVEHAVLLADGA